MSEEEAGDEPAPRQPEPDHHLPVSTISNPNTIGGVDDATMEDIIDKLKVLEYEAQFCLPKTFRPLTRTYFTRPSPYNSNPNQNDQFFYFTSLVAWIMDLAGHHFQAPGQFDDPNASASSIIFELKSMDFSTKDLAPGKLRLGHGDGVLYVLTLLLDKVLSNMNWQFKTPQWTADGYDDEMEVDEGRDDEPTAMEDTVPSDSEEEEEYLGPKGSHANVLKTEEVSGLIETSCDAEEWRLEAERVVPLLKLRRRNDYKDWRTHIDWIQMLLKTVDKTFPEVRTQLERITEEINGAIEKIQKREQTLAEQFEAFVEEFKAQKSGYSGITERYKESCDAVNGLSNELNSVTELLENMKTDIQTREESMQDTSSLGKIKDAMTKIKQEIKEMELRIGVLQHTILHHKIRHAGIKELKSSKDDDYSDDEAEQDCVPGNAALWVARRMRYLLHP
eukprot:NODE_430_length_1678_cov_287.227747_g335_i0.p1 GENE.NODE_430_length_1678_cov_287.227747_g335_i0~~NODE_430_length_1678_cov_287.227747_g335_i0.p1  ORF type:complete len:448 (-),score=120.23 NODE_430_length_1678_cov_287.227747_g335_i0:260-1603(-)